ncbi:hypothetical protein ATANTOWER_032732 [Ataeniobius toweri]|uniref:Uncharacterized protein n=1 Tax=Ataeniobius toweri TaxID=208326 RepID=A0ABU7AMZ3_9TELE|nr:hypothetical protein [Ataeniobius toweri]
MLQYLPDNATFPVLVADPPLVSMRTRQHPTRTEFISEQRLLTRKTWKGRFSLPDSVMVSDIRHRHRTTLCSKNQSLNWIHRSLQDGARVSSFNQNPDLGLGSLIYIGATEPRTVWQLQGENIKPNLLQIRLKLSKSNQRKSLQKVENCRSRSLQNTGL